MEAVPRLPMIRFKLKTSDEKPNFQQKLKEYIQDHYNEDPESYNNQINQLEGLRAVASHPPKDVTGCAALKRYYCQINFLSSRFPMHKNGECVIKFTWKDPYTDTEVYGYDINLELAAILYNIGALHTRLGAADNRSTPDGLKMACTHYQCAAWAFQHIPEEYPDISNNLISNDLLAYMNILCLAQGQECILEKSMMDNRKSSIIAKIAIQTVEYYRLALKKLSKTSNDDGAIADVIGIKLRRKWDGYLKFKISYHGCIGLLYQGQNSEEEQKMGERVAYYQAAFEKLEEARKLSRGLDKIDAINEALQFTQDVVEGKRKAAKNENEFIYHEEVPNISTLPELKGAALVKGISFNVNDPDVSGPDIFSNLIPLKAHETSSVYSEELAKIMRKIVPEVMESNEALDSFIYKLQLDSVRPSVDWELPQEVIDRCAAISAKPDAIEVLHSTMANLSQTYEEVESMLMEIQAILDKEEKDVVGYEGVVGKRPPSIVATDLTREAKKYRDAHVKASESNQTLHKAMQIHTPNLKMLFTPIRELESKIPTVSVASPEDQAAFNRMETLMSKVKEMKDQREMLFNQLREAISADDITQKIVTFTGESKEELFKQEMAKHQKHIDLIHQNLAAQNKIIAAIEEAYIQYGVARRNLMVQIQRRDAMVNGLVSSFDAYEDLITKSNKGLEFYNKLHGNVSKLLQRVKSTCKVQEEEREQVLASIGDDRMPDSARVESARIYNDLSAPGANLKLKDYLNMKKETGKMSLIPSEAVSYIPPATYEPAWVPGVRPAPVGSEEIDTNTPKPPVDGIYHGKNPYPEMGRTATPISYQYPASYSQTYPAVSNDGYSYPPQQYSDTSHQQSVAYPQNAYYSQTSYPATYYAAPQQNNQTFAATNPPQYYGSDTASVAQAYPNSQNYPTAGYNTYTSENSQTYNPTLATANPTSYSTATPSTYPADKGTNSAGNYPTVTPTSYPSDSTPAYSFPAPNSYPVDKGGYSATDYSTAGTSYPATNYSPAAPTSYPAGSGSYSATNYSSATPTSYPADSGSYSATNYSLATPTSYPADSGSYSATNYSSATPTSYPADGGSYSATNYSAPTTAYPPDAYSNPTYQTNWNYVPSQYGTNNQETKYQNTDASVYTQTQPPQVYTPTSSNVYMDTSKTANSYPAMQYASPGAYNQTGASEVAYSSGIPPQSLNIDQQYHGEQFVQHPAGNSATQSPVTYRQASLNNIAGATTTTNSGNSAMPSPSVQKSNVDLLAGLEFDVTVRPLQPQMPAQSSPVKVAETKQEVVQKPPSVEVVQKPTAVEVKANVIEKKMDVDTLRAFAPEVEKFEKFVEGLTVKTLNGPTTLDVKWKEITDCQENESQNRRISVARCYPLKNRFPDVLPFDDTRIELPSTKDEYINASLLKKTHPSLPSLILTQAPLPTTYEDFWSMVTEQQVEVMICLLGDNELGGHIYWPVDKVRDLHLGRFRISLQSCQVKPHWVERILSVTSDGKVSRVVAHLQYTSWPGSSFPASPAPFLTFVQEAKSFLQQQRSINHPALVHCLAGVGRTGFFVLLLAATSDILAGNGIPDLVTLTLRISQARKNSLRDREHLKFAYQSILYFCQDLLLKNGILTNGASYEDKKRHSRHPSQDFLVSSESGQLTSKLEALSLDGINAEAKTEQQPATSEPSSNIPQLAAMDPNAFSISMHDVKPGRAKQKFTPESFTNPSATLKADADVSSSDPLSSLDPLWTLKK